jgi:hypothetical protein
MTRLWVDQFGRLLTPQQLLSFGVVYATLSKEELDSLTCIVPDRIEFFFPFPAFKVLVYGTTVYYGRAQNCNASVAIAV